MKIARWTGVAGLAALVVTSGLVAVAPAAAAEPTTIIIETPADGTSASGENLTVSGTFSNTSELTLVVGAQELIPISSTGTSGSWTIDVDISDVDGRFDLAVRGVDLSTKYTTWSNFVAVEVENPDAERPTVTILSPTEGAFSGDTIDVVVEANSPRALSAVEVRKNSGDWVPAIAGDVAGEYRVSLPSTESSFVGLQARATDASGLQTMTGSTYVALNGATAADPQRYDQDRAVWVWEPASYKAVFDTAARDHMGAVLDDTETFNSDPMTTIYLGVDMYQGRDMLRDSQDEVAAFVTWAKGRGYNVQATVAGGTRPPYLGALEQFEHFAVSEFEKVLDYNLAVPVEARFDGINVDIEPYILTEWKAPGNTLPLRWLETLETLMDRRDASGTDILVGPAIPRWLDTSDCCTTVSWNGETKPLSEHIQDMTDYISIMDYRDTADGGAGIIAQAQNEINYANTIGKPDSVIIGVETKDLSGGGDPETVTFFEEGRTHLEAELDKVYAAFEGEGSFGGIAMHHFDSLLELPSSWEDAEPVYYPESYPCVAEHPEWDTAATYTAGAQITFDCATWEATWWTRGQVPGDSTGPWQEIRESADGVAEWTPTRIFTAGENVTFDGQSYRALWWTRNETPGDTPGPWERISS